jgi:serine/threonine protein kinase
VLEAGDWKRADDLLQAALDLPAEQRDRWISEACGDDTALKERVLELIRLAQADSDVLRPGGALAGIAGDRRAFALAPGSRLGRYEIRELLGSGGMGRVYSALDPTLGREVAIKALAETFRDDSASFKRFEREARVLASLNHPNIAAIYGFEQLDGAPYLILERIEGETLGQRLKKAPLSLRDAVAIAIQIAEGLAEAHSKGVSHRDLKPSNVMLASGGRVKLVDFGLAKTTKVASPSSAAAVSTHLTEEGRVMGTAPYMSPEQIRGEAVDARSDVWAFGCVLYEMLSGRHAFEGHSAPEVLAAALRDEPDWSALPRATPPGLRRLLTRCLRKDPKRRLQHIGDARLELLDLESEGDTAPTAQHPKFAKSRLPAMLASASALVVLTVVFFVGRRTSMREPPRWQKLTYQLGWVREGRFTPDGQSVLYSAAWDGGPLRIYRKHPESPEAVPLDLPSASILGISRSGELAIALDCRSTHPGVCSGTLARAALTGGSPREIAEGVQQADWAPDGNELVIVRDVPGGTRLERPPGRVLYETAGHISCPRISPAGDLIAFFDHPHPNDDRGRVAVVDLAGKKRQIGKDWESLFGLAWNPSGSEIWFTASEAGARRELYAVTLSGRLRAVFRAPSSLSLLDISRNGKVLLACEDLRLGIRGAASGETAERELSWLDRSFSTGISRDGRLLLLTEQSEAAGGDYAACIRRMDGSRVTRLGPGWAMSISPDSKLVLTKLPGPQAPLSIVPVGPGPTRLLKTPGLDCHWGAWLPDGRHVLVSANRAGERTGLYVVDVESETWRPFKEGRFSAGAVSPDGKYIAGPGPDGVLALQPLEGDAAIPVRGALPGDTAVGFSDGGRTLLVMLPQRVPREVFRIDLETGARSRWRAFVPQDPAGVSLVLGLVFSADASAYAYSYYRSLAVIYAVDGLL